MLIGGQKRNQDRVASIGLMSKNQQNVSFQDCTTINHGC